MLVVGSGSSQRGERPAAMPPGAKELKKRAQNRRNRRRSLDSRNKNVDKQRSRDHAREQRKLLEAIDGSPHEKVSLREKHGVII